MQQVEISKAKLSDDGSFALYGISVNGSEEPATWRRYQEFLLFLHKLPHAVQDRVKEKFPPKLWSSSVADKAVKERKKRLGDFLEAVLQQVEQKHSSDSTDVPPQWVKDVYNFCGYSSDVEQILALERALKYAEERLEQHQKQTHEQSTILEDSLSAKQEQKQLLERTLEEMESKASAILQEKQDLERKVLEESQEVRNLQSVKEDLERSLMEERENRETDTKEVQQLKKLRGELEREIARLEASQKSASAYGSSLSAKLTKMETDYKRQEQKMQEELQRMKQEMEEKEEEWQHRVAELEHEVEAADQIKLRLASRVETLKAENAALQASQDKNEEKKSESSN